MNGSMTGSMNDPMDGQMNGSMNHPMDGSKNGPMNGPTDCPMTDPTNGSKADLMNDPNGRPVHSSYKYHFAKNRQTGPRRRDRARPPPIIHQK